MFVAGKPPTILPRDAQFIRRAPVGYHWSLYYSKSQRLYYKLTPMRGGYDVQTGSTIASCCGSKR
jgi:hypothetical protein